MRRTRVSLVALLIFSLLLPGPAWVQGQVPSDVGTSKLSDVGYYDPSQNISGAVTLGNNGSYLFLNKWVGDRPGSEDGFWNAGLFAPLLNFENDTRLIGDVRMMMADDKRIGYNVGLIGRHRVTSFDWNRILGAYVYYDNDVAESRFKTDQITVGAEWLGDWWDARANGYLVLDEDDRKVLGITQQGTTPIFRNDTFVFDNMRLVQQAVSGADLEFGAPIGPLHWLKAYAGVYYYDAKVSDEDGIGVRGRFEARVSDDAMVQVAITDDDQFGTNVQLGVSLTFSGARRMRMFPKWSIEQRMFEQVQRNWRVATTTFEEQFETPFINPNTGRPFGPGSIVFVDKSNPVAGTNNNPLPGATGTFSEPYQSVSGSIPGAEIIVVRVGGTTIADPLVSDFVLLNGQELLGEGLPHTFAGGAINFPGLATSGQTPFVTTDDGGNIITLANNNTVNGLNLIAPNGGNAIVGNGIKDFTITNINQDVNLPDTTGAGGGIVLTNATGTGSITNARFNMANAMAPGGVVIANSGSGTLNLTLDTLPFVQGGQTGLGLTAQNNAVINAQVEDFTASNNGTGMRLRTTNNGAIDIDVSNSTFDTSTAGPGISLVGNNGAFNLSLENVTADQSASDALNIELTNNSRFTGKIEGGSFLDAGQVPTIPDGNGIDLTMAGSSLSYDGSTRASLSLTGESAASPVRFDNARGDGFRANLTNGSQIDVVVTNGSFVAAGEDAFDISLDNNSVMNLDVDPTPAVGAAANGLLFDVRRGSQLMASFLDGNFSSSGLSGVLGTVDGANSAVTLMFDNTPINGSGQTGTGDGFNVAATNSADLVAMFSNSVSSLGTNGAINDSANNGIVASVTGNATATLVFDDTPVNGSGARGGIGSGLVLDVNTGGQLDFIYLNGSMNDSRDYGIVANVANAGSVANLSFVNTPINNSGVTSNNLVDNRNGLDFSVSDGAQFNASFTGGSLSGSRDHGIHADVSGGAAATLAMDSTPVENSMNGDGFNFDVTTGGNLTATIANGSFNNSGDNFIDGLVINPGSVATVTLENTTLDTSGGEGLLFDVLDSGVLNFDLDGATIANTGGPGLVMALDGMDTTQNLNFSDVNLSGAEFDITNGATLNADFVGGSLTGSTTSGLLTNVENFGSEANFTFLSTIINGNAGSGFEANVSDQAMLTADFNGGSVSQNADNGILLNVQDSGSAADLSMTQTNVDENAAGDGLHFNVTGGALLSSSNGISGVTFNDNASNAVDGTVDGAGSAASLGMASIQADRNGEEGFLLDVTNQGELTLMTSGTDAEPSTILQSGQTGVLATVDGAGSTATLTFGNTDIDESGQSGIGMRDGVNLAVTNGAVAAAEFNASSISSSGGNGLTLNVNAGSSVGLALTETDISSNLATGIDADFDGAGTAIGMVMTSSNVDGNGLGGAGNGFRVDATNGATFQADITQSSISGSQDGGLIATLDGAGTVASLEFESTIINNSGIVSGAGSGAELLVTNGAALGFDYRAGSISNNSTRGLVLDVDGAGSMAAVDIDVDADLNPTLINGNRNGDGFRFDAADQAQLSVDVTGASFSNNGVDSSANGVFGNVTGAGTVADVVFDATTASGNTGDVFTPTGAGFRLHVDDGATLTAAITNASVAENNTNSGVRFDAQDAGTVASLTMTGSNLVQNNGRRLGHFDNVSNSDGIDVDAVDIDELRVELSGSISGNGGAGADIRLDNVQLVPSLNIDSLTVTNNGGIGVRIDADDTMIQNGTVTGNMINNNNTNGIAGAGFQLDLTNSPAPEFVISDNTQIDGVSFVLNNSPLDNLVVANNVISGNATGDGISFDVTDSNVLGAIANNLIENNAGSGIAFEPTATPAFVANNGGPMVLDFRTSFTNRLTGMAISGISGGNVITGNTGDPSQDPNNLFNGAGIHANLGMGARLVADITSNMISDNASFGVGVRAQDGTFDVNVGGSTTDPLTGEFTDTNVIDNNVGAGVAFLVLDTSGTDPNNPNTFRVLNNVITNTSADAITTNSYIGDGVHVQLSTTNLLANSTAVLTNPIIDGNYIGTMPNGTAAANEGRGITVNMQDDTEISDFDIVNNVVNNNGGTGIQFLRLDDAVLSDQLDSNADPNAGPLTRSVTINDNVIVNNGTGTLGTVPAPESIDNLGSGIDIVARNGGITTNDFEISGNMIADNAFTGISTDTGADARIIADIRDNVVDNNGSDGIRVTEEVNDPTDLRTTQGTWIKNTITNNAGHGIQLAGATGGSVALSIGLDGVDPNDGKNRGNRIANNGQTGIIINGSGNSWIINNEISGNGSHGVDVNALGVTNPSTTLLRNVIIDNRGDGLEIGNGTSVTVDVTANGNTIRLNDGRGVDILNRDQATLNVSFGDGTVAGRNFISENGLEGFYVVNAAAPNQDQDLPSTELLVPGDQENGDRVARILDTRDVIAADADMVLNLDNNVINGNGKDSGFQATGLVLRVSTSNAGTSFSSPANGLGSEDGNLGNGRVNARIVNNSFEGNFGVDAYIESFTGTVDPPNTGGTWTDMDFMVNGGFRRDPLARLNLVFQGNDGNSLDVTNVGAFYDNDEGDFKSRTGGRNAPAPNGPFSTNAAGRRRNATRIAARTEDLNGNGVLDFGEDTNSDGVIDSLMPTINTADGMSFLYDGVGQSTFRIAPGFDGIDGVPNDGLQFTNGIGFFVDSGPVPDFSFGNSGLAPILNANGFVYADGGPNQIRWGWGTWLPNVDSNGNPVTSFPAPFQGVAPFQPMP